jgi:hypothetical protein
VHPEPDIHHFRERFEQLAEEAGQYGIMTVVAMAAGDPIAQREEVALLSRGSRIMTIGLLTQALWHMQNDVG